MTDPTDPVDRDDVVSDAVDESIDPQVIEPADATLLAQLRQAVATHDPVPDRALAAARAAYTWRTIDAELAELAVDSTAGAAGVRGMAWPRQLSFEARAASIEVEVSADRIVGQVVPPAEIDITLTTPDGEVQATRSTAAGHFTFEVDGSGTVRITAVLPGGAVTTQWFTLR